MRQNARANRACALMAAAPCPQWYPAQPRDQAYPIVADGGVKQAQAALSLRCVPGRGSRRSQPNIAVRRNYQHAELSSKLAGIVRLLALAAVKGKGARSYWNCSAVWEPAIEPAHRPGIEI